MTAQPQHPKIAAVRQKPADFAGICRTTAILRYEGG
jgi:hypothetical protein